MSIFKGGASLCSFLGKTVFVITEKTNKVYKFTFLEREFQKESIKIVRFLAKNHIFEKLPKTDFLAQNCFRKGKKIFLDKNHKKIAKAI